MSLNHPDTQGDWIVITSTGQRVTVPKVNSAYVDDKTGTLVFAVHGHGTVTVFARGAWLQVTPS
jgi:hypothetical protein